MIKKISIIIVSILILSFVFSLTYLYSNRYVRIIEMREKIAILEKKLKAQKAKNRELAVQVELLKIPKYIEKVAREELGLVKPGEVLFLPRRK